MYVASLMGWNLFGWRYALSLTPLFFLLVAAAIRWLWRWRPAAILAATGVLATFVVFWPNVRLIPNPWLDPPREEIKPVLTYLNQQIQPGDSIYVYYGAVPAYQLYQPETGHSTEYGIWFRAWPLEDKLQEIMRVVGESPRFWLVMAHIYQNEDTDLISGLAGGHSPYQLVDRVSAENAAVALFQRNDP